MLTDMQIQPQLIGDTHRDAVQAFQGFGKSRFEIAADLTEVLDGQPGNAMRRVDQGPAQRAALHRFEDFFGGVTLQALVAVRLVEHAEIADQKQSRHAGQLQTFDQRVDCQHLFNRPERH